MILRTLWKWRRVRLERKALKYKITCTQCAATAKPRWVTPGSDLLTAVLWVMFIIPGVLYYLDRVSRRYKTCRVCGSKDVIPALSPRAQLMRSQLLQKGA